ncbi:endonuclease V [Domibacillus robiginosus]|uniref:endonuclease V n=1 Tax=Domibacillus robiginosus TaxID=1071054 RepID=UPI001FDF0ECB|nr:endonuclease V [Domibacillus robiginosus]
MDKKCEEKWDYIQNTLKAKIHLENTFQLDEIRLVAGVDLAYWSDQKANYGVCCIQVLDYTSKKVIEQAEYAGEVEVPYISGYLAFRELPFILKAAEKLKTSPDLYMFDGNGYLHSRHMGIATQASFDLGKPTIGIAKTYLKIGNNTDFTMPENKAGAYTDIVIDGEVYGRALRTRTDVKPVFVSGGNWIDLHTAVKITMHFVEKESRLPVTTRYADLATHEARRRYQK